MLLKKAFAVVLLIAASACSAPAGAGALETGFLHRTVEVDGVAYKYQIYVPPGFTPTRKWPVILFLHGNGESGEDGLRQTEHGLGPALRAHAERFPAIVVFPQARRRSPWVGPMEAQAMKALEQSVAEFNGDPRRIYLTGVSLGGYGTWAFAAQHPGKFAALVPVAGGVVPPAGYMMPPGVAALGKAGNRYIAALESPDPYATIARIIGKTPAWVFHGEVDRTVAVAESRRMVEALKAAAGNVKYTEYAGAGHSITERVYADPELATWLFAQRLGQ